MVLNALTFQKVGIGFARYSMRLFDQKAESVKALNESAQALELLAKKN